MATPMERATIRVEAREIICGRIPLENLCRIKTHLMQETKAEEVEKAGEKLDRATHIVEAISSARRAAEPPTNPPSVIITSAEESGTDNNLADNRDPDVVFSADAAGTTTHRYIDFTAGNSGTSMSTGATTAAMGHDAIVGLARKSVAPGAVEQFLSPRESEAYDRRLRWSPSVNLDNFSSPVFTAAFRDNVARSMTMMLERYVKTDFTSSELANQRRIKAHLDLKQLGDEFRAARLISLSSMGSAEERYYAAAMQTRIFETGYNKLNTYLNQEDEVVNAAKKFIHNEIIQVEKRELALAEKAKELVALKTEVEGIKWKMRRLQPFVEYLNGVIKMQDQEAMFPNRLAIIQRVETLMTIRSEMIKMLEYQFNEETVTREAFFKERDRVNTIHDRCNDTIRRLNLLLDHLERKCSKWNDLIAKKESEECGTKSMKGQCIRAIDYMYETMAKFKGMPIRDDLTLLEKLAAVAKFIEHRLGVEKEVERQEEEAKKKEERRRKRMANLARKRMTRMMRD